MPIICLNLKDFLPTCDIHFDALNINWIESIRFNLLQVVLDGVMAYIYDQVQSKEQGGPKY